MEYQEDFTYFQDRKMKVEKRAALAAELTNQDTKFFRPNRHETSTSDSFKELVLELLGIIITAVPFHDVHSKFGLVPRLIVAQTAANGFIRPVREHVLRSEKNEDEG